MKEIFAIIHEERHSGLMISFITPKQALGWLNGDYNDEDDGVIPIKLIYDENSKVIYIPEYVTIGYDYIEIPIVKGSSSKIENGHSIPIEKIKIGEFINI